MYLLRHAGKCTSAVSSRITGRRLRTEDYRQLQKQPSFPDLQSHFPRGSLARWLHHS